jgi:hypothetical protein
MTTSATSSQHGSTFSEPLVAVYDRSARSGYIDGAGELVIPTQFDGAYDFREGRARIRVGSHEAGKYGYIDSGGRVVIAAHFDDAEDFAGGFACVKAGGLFGFIDCNGQWLFKPQFESARGFSEGIAAVVRGGLWGYVSTAGAVAIEPRFRQWGGNFSEGLALVKDAQEAGYAYIDRNGAPVIQVPYELAADFAEGLAAVCRDSKWGYIDRSGAMQIEPRYDRADEFSEGMAAVFLREEEDDTYTVGYITREGVAAVPFAFVFARPFSEGVAAVARGTRDACKWGYIDKGGREVIPCQFDVGAHEFRHGLASVAVNSPEIGGILQLIIDRSGREVWNPLKHGWNPLQNTQAKAGCFIATAVYGDEWNPDVVALRRFRDDVLARGNLGQAALDAYYRTSPTLARYVARSAALRHALREWVFRPIVRWLGRTPPPESS